MIVWFIVAILAAIGELVTYDLFLAMVSVAAIITIPAAFFLPLPVQVVLFSALSLIGIIVIRPIVKRALKLGAAVQIEAEETRPHLVGKRAVVTQQVDSHGGQVRVGQGEFWSARVYGPADCLPAGTPVEVMYVDGVTAFVAPLASEAALPSNSQMSSST